MDPRSDGDALVAVVNHLLEDQVPFHDLLGLNIEALGEDHAEVSLEMRRDLMGHHARGMLHGGAISAVIDVAGGLCAMMGVQKRMPGEPLEARIERLGRVSTIDVHVDFLRPGKGTRFVATANALKNGRRVAVARIDVKDEHDQLIATGTGSYLVS